MAYKQQPKSPVLKALVGDQHKLPKVLKDAIIASPAKQTDFRPDSKPPKMTDGQRKEIAKRMSEGFAEMAPSVLSTIKPTGFRPDSKPPKQTPSARRKTIKDANKTYSPDKVKSLEKKLSKDRKDTGKVYGPGSAKALKNFQRKEISNTVKSLKKDRNPDERVYKSSSPAKQTKKNISVGKEAMKGAMRGAAQAMASRSGQTLTATNPALGAVSAGKAALREGLKAGVAAKKAKTKAERAAAKGAREAMADTFGKIAKSPAKQTKPKKKSPKYTGKITNIEKRKGKPGYTVTTRGSVDPKVVRNATKTGKVPSPKKTQQKVKNKGPKKTLNGNVIKY